MTVSLEGRCRMRFAGYDHRAAAEVPCGVQITSVTAWSGVVIVAGRYTLPPSAEYMRAWCLPSVSGDYAGRRFDCLWSAPCLAAFPCSCCCWLALWLAASYGLRYGFMEDARWVGVCIDEAGRWECSLRSSLGWMIHFRRLGWSALGRRCWPSSCQGRRAVVAGGAGLGGRGPALVLYNTTLAVFALVIGSLAPGALRVLPGAGSSRRPRPGRISRSAPASCATARRPSAG